MVGLTTIEQVQAVFPGRLKFTRLEQVNGDKPHFLASLAELIKRNLFVTPAADGVVNVSFQLHEGRRFMADLRAGRKT